MCLDVSKKILLSDLAKFWWRICPQSVFKLDKYCTKLQRILVLCLLIKVCVLCSQLDFLAISPLSFIRDLGPKGLWVQIVCVSSLAILVLIYCCLNVFLQLFFLFSHCFCFFPQWRLYSETVRGSPHPGAQLHWSPSGLLPLVSPLACGEGFIPSVHVQVGFTTIQTHPHVYCYLLLHTALCSFLLFHVTTCLSELWMYENTHQPLVFAVSFCFLYLAAIFNSSSISLSHIFQNHPLSCNKPLILPLENKNKKTLHLASSIYAAM